MLIKNLGNLPYLDAWQEMQNFTMSRTDHTEDELWVLEHPPVFTQGTAGKPEHLLISSPHIPVIQSDRGGQITYHGPGQIIIYLLIDIKRRKLNIKQLVCFIETAVINTLKEFNISSYSDKNAPGVYTNIKDTRAKICSLGLRIKRGCTYHGLALNYNMDLTPFTYINPCGFEKLEITQIHDLNNLVSSQTITEKLCNELTYLINTI